MLMARGAFLILHARFHHAAAGFLLHGGRIKELLKAFCHAVLLVALQVVQLVCRRLGSAQVLHGGGVYWAVGSQHAGDGGAALSDHHQPLGLPAAGVPPTSRSISRW